MLAKIIDEQTIHIYGKTQFDWYAIRSSGQIFRDPPCRISEEADKIVVSASGGKDSAWLWNYFDLDTDYAQIKKELACFSVLREPMNVGGGLRILRQPFAETVICFIISANNNIKRFTKTIEQIDFGGLGKYTEEDFKKMGCGYRAPYLVKTAAALAETSVAELDALDDEALRKRLMSFAGVGPKVAACIMLFAFHRLSVAPVDTWIKKAIEQIGESESAELFSHRYAGVAQQYIFYYMQHLHGELNKQ